MKQQNNANHSRYVPLYHFITPVLIITVLVSAIIHLVNTPREFIFEASMPVALALAVLFIWVYMRQFALKAQDRAIRAEENFRHFHLTGKPHDHRLSIGQVIALRFADDDEFLALAKHAAEESLSPKQIKGEIKKWRADHHRA